MRVSLRPTRCERAPSARRKLLQDPVFLRDINLQRPQAGRTVLRQNDSSIDTLLPVSLPGSFVGSSQVSLDKFGRTARCDARTRKAIWRVQKPDDDALDRSYRSIFCR
jgi:hypothetical protein